VLWLQNDWMYWIATSADTGFPRVDIHKLAYIFTFEQRTVSICTASSSTTRKGQPWHGFDSWWMSMPVMF
jgi:hypothetical protein